MGIMGINRNIIKLLLSFKQSVFRSNVDLSYTYCAILGVIGVPNFSIVKESRKLQSWLSSIRDIHSHILTLSKPQDFALFKVKQRPEIKS